MLKTNLERFSKLDAIVNENANGIYVIPSNQSQSIRISDLIKYCELESKAISDLSSEEIEKFYR